MRKSLMMGLAALLAVNAVGATQRPTPEEYAGAPAKHFHEVDTDWMKAFHNPMEGLEMGLDLRLREVYSRNMLDRKSVV